MTALFAPSTWKKFGNKPLTRGLVLSCILILSACEGPQPLKVGTPGAQQPTTVSQPITVIPTQPLQQPTQGEFPTVDIVPTEVVQVPTDVPIPPTDVIPTIPVVQPPSGEAAWNVQKIDVVQFEGTRTYKAPGSVLLQWYDPTTGQFVGLGWTTEPLVATAEFRLRWSGIRALAIPYTINGSYGIILEPSVVERIRKSYSGDSIEAFVWLAPDMVQQ